MSNLRLKIASDISKAAAEKMALTYSEKRPIYFRPISETIGRLSSIPTAIMIGSTAPLGRTANITDPEMAAVLSDLKYDEALAGTHVSFGDTYPAESLSRVWNNRKIGLLSKMLGTAAIPINDLLAQVQRMDNYNPYSDTVTMFSSDPAILRHELGHAQDFASRSYPIPYYMLRQKVPLLDLYQEGVASVKAVDHLADNLPDLIENEVDKEIIKLKLDEIARTNRVLGGGLGSYAGAATGGLGARLLMPRLLTRFGPIMEKVPGGASGPKAKILMNLGGVVGGALSGALLGQAIGAAVHPFSRNKSLEKILAAEEVIHG